MMERRLRLNFTISGIRVRFPARIYFYFVSAVTALVWMYFGLFCAHATISGEFSKFHDIPLKYFGFIFLYFQLESLIALSFLKNQFVAYLFAVNSALKHER